MRIKLVKAQRYACIATAWVIVLLQLLSFAQGGVYGSDWVFSFIVAAVFGLLGTRRITGGQKETSASPEGGPSNESSAANRKIDEHEKVSRENGAILAIEVETLADLMTRSILPRPEPGAASPLGDLEVPQLFAVIAGIRERTLLACLGLVAIRRAEKNHRYVSGSEYLEMEHKVCHSFIFAGMSALQVSETLVNPEQIAARAREHLQFIRGLVAEAAKAAERGEAEPERPLLAWLEEGGITLPGDRFIRSALGRVNEAAPA